MKPMFKNILTSINNAGKLLAVLIDPDKMDIRNLPSFIEKVNASRVTHIFVGGSTVNDHTIEDLVIEIKKYSKRPIVIFPGDTTQITNKADALLFLSLISGRDPKYLIEKQIEAVPILKHTNLEVIPTGYLLIENGKETSVQKVTGTQPMRRKNIKLIANTAKAGELLGMQLIYLEAGSGATHPVNSEIIRRVKQELKVPLLVGGGIKNDDHLQMAYNAGADMVVIGTAFEEDESIFNELS